MQTKQLISKNGEKRVPAGKRVVMYAEAIKLPLAACQDIQNSGELVYTDDEVLRIRDFFYLLAAVTFKEWQYRQGESKVVSINQIQRYEKSDYLRTG
jgi:hypothetical protein